MQSALSSANDSLPSSVADTGSTTSPDSSSESKVASSVAIVTNPSPLDPNNLPQQFSIRWTYTNCPRSTRGGTLNGTRCVNVNLDSNRTAAETFALTRDYVNGADLKSDGNSTIVTVGWRNSGSVSRTVYGDGSRVFTGAAGNERVNHTYTHTLDVNETYVPNTQDANTYTLSQRVINGSGQLNHNLIDAVSVTTFTNGVAVHERHVSAGHAVHEKPVAQSWCGAMLQQLLLAAKINTTLRPNARNTNPWVPASVISAGTPASPFSWPACSMFASWMVACLVVAPKFTNVPSKFSPITSRKNTSVAALTSANVEYASV